MVDPTPGQTPADDDERPAWARWITLGSLVLAAGALAWTIYSVGLYEILRRLALIGPWFLVVVAVEAVITLFDAGALHAFLRPDHRKVGYGRVVLAQVSSRAINAVTPLGSLGEVVKTTMLFERVSPSRAVAAVLLYNITVLEISFVLIALGATSTALLLDLPSSLRTMLVVSAAVTAVLAIVIPVLVAKGRLAGLVTLGRMLRVVPARKERRWRKKLADIDEKLGDTGGGGRRRRRPPPRPRAGRALPPRVAPRQLAQRRDPHPRRRRQPRGRLPGRGAHRRPGHPVGVDGGADGPRRPGGRQLRPVPRAGRRSGDRRDHLHRQAGHPDHLRRDRDRAGLDQPDGEGGQGGPAPQGARAEGPREEAGALTPADRQRARGGLRARASYCR
jgi:hypothetical protein